jgi:hypothetical protein
VASLITLYHLVQIRAAWREVLTGNRRQSVAAPVTPSPETKSADE